MLFVIGEAGLGKTAVLARAVSACGASVAIGQAEGNPMETSLPYSLLVQATRGLDGGRDTFTNESPGLDGPDARVAGFYRALRWLEDQGNKPMLLALDDVHWADDDSLALLAFLCRRIDSLPVAVIATLRPWPSAAEQIAVDLVHTGHATIERLARLTPRASRALLIHSIRRPVSRSAIRRSLALCAGDPLLLLHRLGRSVSTEMLQRALDLCAGNPLLLEQMAQALRQGENVPWMAGGTAASSWRYLLLGRFARLQAAGLHWVRAASVLGPHFRVGVASEVAGLHYETAGAVEEVWRSGLVSPADMGFAEFVHPLVAQAVYEDLSPALRADLHHRSFEVLVEHGLEQEAAEHAVRARLVGDRRAVSALTGAAGRARRAGALSAATRHLAAAVDLAGNNPEPGVVLALGGALLAESRFAETISLASRLLARNDVVGADRAGALRLRAKALSSTGAHTAAERDYVRALDVTASEDSSAAVKAQLDCAILHWLAHGPDAAMEQANGMRQLAPSPEQGLRNHVEAFLGVVALQRGQPDGFDSVTTAAQATLAQGDLGVDNIGRHFDTLLLFGFAAMWVGRFDEAERVLRDAHKQAGRTGAVQAAALLRYGQVAVLRRQGRFPAALALSYEAAAEEELVPRLRPFILTSQAHLLLELDRSEEAGEVLTRADEAAAESGVLARLEYLHLRSMWLLRQGRATEASDGYRRTEELARAAGIREPCVVPFGTHAVTAHLQSGRLEDACRVTGWLEEAAALPCPWTELAALMTRARVAERCGDVEAAAAGYRSAFGRLEQFDLPLQRIEVLVAFGGLLRRSSQPTAARAALGEALQGAERQGAGWLMRQAQEELAAAGGRRRRRQHDPCRLTPQEERIARLAAAGASNQEIASQLYLSAQTVKGHLQSVFTKLGVHSRAELNVPLARYSQPGH